MTVLIDSNVALDVLLNNAGLVAGSRALLDLAYKKRFAGYISASAVTDIFYISAKKLGKKAAKNIKNNMGNNIQQAGFVNCTDITDSKAIFKN